MKLTETISLNECRDGFWLYDYTRGRNLAMREASEKDAFIKAITYYQKRLAEVEKEYGDLRKKVDNFVEQYCSERL